MADAVSGNKALKVDNPLVRSEEREDLGGNLYHGDPDCFSFAIIDYVVNRFAVRSALDLGAGRGFASAYMVKAHGIPVVAVDGLEKNALDAVYPVLRHDITQAPVCCRVDLVYCSEVVEHIDRRHLDKLLGSLACGRIVLMTHGLPGQGGHHHVNNQPSEYWVMALKKKNFSLLQADTLAVRRLGKGTYFENSGLVFGRDPADSR